jgi:hypothetical protein
VNILKQKYAKILEVKEKAKTKNVIFLQVIYFTMIGIFTLSIFSSIFMILGVSILQSELGMDDNWVLNTIMEQALLITLATVTWFLLVPMMRFVIYALDHFNKLLAKVIMKAIDKLDMYWFRKYRTHSPVTKFIDKVQTKAADKNTKWSKNKKRALKIGLIVGLIMLQVWMRFPMIESVYYDSVDGINEMEAEEIESDIGKIKSPLSTNPLLQNTENEIINGG